MERRTAMDRRSELRPERRGEPTPCNRPPLPVQGSIAGDNRHTRRPVAPEKHERNLG